MLPRRGKHDNNPEATLSISVFPAVFNPSFDPLSSFLCAPLLIIDVCCAVADESKINKLIEKEWWRKEKLRLWSSNEDLGEKVCPWRAGSLPVQIKWMLIVDDSHCLPEHLMAGQCHSPYASRAYLTSFILVSRFYKTEQLIKGHIFFFFLLLNTRN